jgi:DNA-binding IclR family transcriptional regulator
MSSLENALKIVSLMNSTRPVLRVGEVCRELGIPKSSISRLLKTLSEYGILEREADDGGYVAGRRGLVLSELYITRHNLLALVDIALNALTAEFQFTGYAAVLTGADIVIIRITHGTYPLRMVQEIGVPMPAFRTSVGRAMLARKPDAEILELVRERGDTPVSDAEILDIIHDVRKTGSATTVSTITPGVAALAVAVHDVAKNEMMGFSISYPTGAVDEAMHRQMLERTREQARAIGRRIGDAFWISLDTRD